MKRITFIERTSPDMKERPQYVAAYSASQFSVAIYQAKPVEEPTEEDNDVV